ncbi:condensation domain-containing protein, partial [Nocardia sp. NPDC057663]|uniref:condensation domain-containing protein n=1 Tax=Nocardia sp. NPDC057663 TaxID=3346201 RepID=UPI003671201B
MWAMEEVAGEKSHNIGCGVEIDGPIDHSLFMKAIELSVVDMIGTQANFTVVDGALKKRVRPLGAWRPFLQDFRNSESPAATAESWAAEVLDRKYAIESDILFRIGLVIVDYTRSILIVGGHHIILDGSLVSRIVQRISREYEAAALGVVESAEPDPAAITSPSKQLVVRGEPVAMSDEEFWSDYLSDFVPMAPLPSVGRGSGALRIETLVTASEVAKWQRAAASMGIGVNQLIAGCFAVYVYRSTAVDGVCVRLATMGGEKHEVDTHAVSANRVPLRVDIRRSDSVASVCARVVSSMRAILPRAGFGEARLHRLVRPGSLENPFGPTLNLIPFLGTVRFGDATGEFEHIRFGLIEDVTFVVQRNVGGGSAVKFITLANDDYYCREDIERFAQGVVDVITSFVRDGSVRVGAIDLLGSTERESVVRAWN